MSHDKQHTYSTRTEWTGNQGRGTADYRAYSRQHVISAPGKPELSGSSDPAFRGDASRWNPEDLLVASLSSCHMLWYLHLCAVNGVVVEEYTDQASGVMEEVQGGAGQFAEVTLRPRVRITAESDAARAQALHEEAHAYCFIASSVNFPVSCDARVSVAET